MQYLLTQPALQTTRPPAEKGQGLVELAVIIPVLVIIVVGALDLGRIFFAIITVTNVSREGARYLTLHSDDRQVVTTNPECYDLDITPPTPKPAYFCTIYAARQEAQVSPLAPVVVNPSQIAVTASCYDGPDTDANCDRRSEAIVTAVYDFHPMTLWFLPNSIPITRITKMMVP